MDLASVRSEASCLSRVPFMFEGKTVTDSEHRPMNNYYGTMRNRHIGWIQSVFGGLASHRYHKLTLSAVFRNAPNSVNPAAPIGNVN